MYLKINENLVPFFIEHLQPRPKGQAMVKFMDVDSTEDASLLAGCEILYSNRNVAKTKRHTTYIRLKLKDIR